jgi:hypothetical protein
MKQPTASEFIVNVEESHVSVIFKPSDTTRMRFNAVRMRHSDPAHQSFFSSAAGAWQYFFSHSSRLKVLGTST